MNKFWISGEIQVDVDEAFMKASNKIEAELNRLLKEFSFGDKITQWAFIAIIRKEDHPGYDEVVKKSSRGKVLEFRLKISHTDFLRASSVEQIRLILESLSRSIILMGKLGVASDTQRLLRIILSDAEHNLLASKVVN